MISHNKKYEFTEYKEKDKLILLPNKDSVGSNDVKFPINVFTEFGNLKACLVGYFDNSANIPEYIGESLFLNTGTYD